jgi:mono/diheme cytochrome c family protein
MGRLLLIAIVVVLAVGLGAFAWIALGPGPLDFAGGRQEALRTYAGPSPTGVPADFPVSDLVARGQYLARAADCQACHTAKGGKPFGGGLALKLPFGTLYSPNLTPDRKTGIGGWTDAQYLAALHRGVGPKANLYPVMPYPAFTYMTDDDALAIRAYLATLPESHGRRPPGTFGFPFNQRGLMKPWTALFNPNHRFQPNADRSPEWNRGAYLSEALAHCGECHTPRNPMQALDNRRKYAGSTVSGAQASNITSDRQSGVGAWSDAELAQYLSEGHAPGRGVAKGPMREVVDMSLRYMTPSDIRAIVTYLRSVPPVSTRAQPQPSAGHAG